MEQRRKRRNSKDIEEAILDAATVLIREGGFGNLCLLYTSDAADE